MSYINYYILVVCDMMIDMSTHYDYHFNQWQVNRADSSMLVWPMLEFNDAFIIIFIGDAVT